MLTFAQLKAQATITIKVEPEEIPIRGNAMCSGDAAADKAYEDQLIKRVNSGDVWGWASVRVIATWNGLEGSDSLGGCTYRDEAEFKADGYYADMVYNAMTELYQQYKTIVEAT